MDEAKLEEQEKVTSTVVDIEDDAELFLCGMSKDDLYETITGKNIKFEKCVEARLLQNKIRPAACEGFDWSPPKYDDTVNTNDQEITIDKSIFDCCVSR